MSDKATTEAQNAGNGHESRYRSASAAERESVQSYGFGSVGNLLAQAAADEAWNEWLGASADGPIETRGAGGRIVRWIPGAPPTRDFGYRARGHGYHSVEIYWNEKAQAWRAIADTALEPCSDAWASFPDGWHWTAQ